MKKYGPEMVDVGGTEWATMLPRDSGPCYMVADVDARIAEAERIMRDELLTDCGQGVSQWYCMVCGVHGDDGKGQESIRHGDCALARWLGLS